MSLPNLPFNMLILGKSKSGKSYLSRYFITNYLSKQNIYDRFNYIIVFTKTQFNNNYDYIPIQWIYSRFDPNILYRMMHLQSLYATRYNKKPHPMLIIFD